MCLGLVELFGSSFYWIGKKFGFYFFKYFFCHTPPISPFHQSSNCIYIRPLEVVPHLTIVLFFSQIYFCLYSLCTAYTTVFKFTPDFPSVSNMFLTNPIQCILSSVSIRTFFTSSVFLLNMFNLCSRNSCCGTVGSVALGSTGVQV